MPKPEFPVKEIRLVSFACAADEPLTPDDPRRCDFTELRGGSPVIVELADTLEQWPGEGKFHQSLLCGHRGSGKSTELLGLKQWADANKFLCVWIEVDLYFDLTELQYSDIYLLAAESVEKEMRLQGMELPPEKLHDVVTWFAEITEENLEAIKSELKVEAGAEAGGGLSLLGKLFAKFSASVLAGSERHKKIRQELRQSPNVLISLTNDLLKSANEKLVHSGREQGLLLLFDNLDRYRAEIINDLLLKGGGLVRRLGCHAIFTMPVELRCSAENAYWDYFSASVILPMLALRERNNSWNSTVAASSFHSEAVELMTQALARRIDIDVLFEDPADAQLLVKMSGGCMRDLLHLVGVARQKSRSSLAEPPGKLTKSGVHHAILEYRYQMAEGLRCEDYERLVAIARRRDQEVQHFDEHALRLLSRRRVLLYRDRENRWFDVHPLLIEDEGFRNVHDATSSFHTS
ncbi:MAG: hypothetical protein ACLP7Q_24565 [Isosphaeraceae bacterium]